MQQYFQKLMGIGELTVLDGVALAKTCMVRVENEKARAKEQEVSPVQVRINELFTKYRALKELGLLTPEVSSILTACIRNKFRKAPDVDTALLRLSSSDGKNIGRGLALALISNTSPETDVDEWIHRYPALQELDRNYSFFPPMMNTLAKRILQTSNKGATHRALSGAALSLMDTYSDVMIYRFYMTGQKFFAKFFLAAIIINILLQVLLVYFQNRKMGKTKLLQEIATTVYLKPAFDAVRVSIGAEQDPQQLLTAELEMSMR